MTEQTQQINITDKLNKSPLESEATIYAIDYANMLFSNSGGKVIPSAEDVEKWANGYIKRYGK